MLSKSSVQLQHHTFDDLLKQAGLSQSNTVRARAAMHCTAKCRTLVIQGHT